MTPAGKRDPGISSYQRRQRQSPPDIDIKRTMARRKPRASPLPFQLSTRKASLAGLLFLAVSLLLWSNASQSGLGLYTPSRVVDWDTRREEVKQAFVTSWDAYSRYAWG
jgi:hypothetical protein